MIFSTSWYEFEIVLIKMFHNLYKDMSTAVDLILSLSSQVKMLQYNEEKT